MIVDVCMMIVDRM